MSRPINRTVYRWMGAGCWLVGLILVVALFNRLGSLHGMVRMAHRIGESPQRTTALDPSGKLRRGDSLYLETDSGNPIQIGYVESVDLSSQQLRLVWYADRSVDHFNLTQHWQSGSLPAVMATLLPPEKRKQIESRIAEVAQQHGQEISAAMLPLIEDGLRRSLRSIEAEFRRSVDRHRDEIDRIADRWNRQWVETRLVPLVKQEVIPILRKHAQPEAESIGRELWGRASLWRFGWKALYDKSPLPQRDLVRQEWEQFTDNEVIPVIEDHSDEIVLATQQILQEISENETIRAEIRSMADELSRDPETRALVAAILRESIVENETLHQTWKDIWSSDQAKTALASAAQRLEPTVRAIGDDLFGSRQQGIDPDFAKVLRNQILGKDRRWIVATPRNTKTMPDAEHSGPVTIDVSPKPSSFPQLNITGGADSL